MKLGLTSFPSTVYVYLENDFRDEIFRKAREKTGSWMNIARYLKVRDSNISGYRNGKFGISLGLCHRLSKLLGNRLSDFESRVTLIGSHSKIGIKNPKFPFNFNTPAGARFVMAILCDGKFSQDLRPTYYNFDPTLRSEVMLAAREIFGDIRISELPKYGMLRFPKIVGYALLKVGINPGDKTRTDPTIPSFIKYGDQNVCKSAVGQIIADEGSVDSKFKKVKISFCKDVTESSVLSKSNYTQNWEIYSPNLLKDSITLLKRLEIRASLPRIGRIRITKGGRIKIDWIISISGYKNFFRLASVPIVHPKKQVAIMRYMDSLTRVGSNESLNNALAALWRIKHEVPHFTTQELSTEMKVSKRYCKSLFRKLRALGYVKVIEKRSPVTPWKYSFTHRGEAMAKSQSYFF